MHKQFKDSRLSVHYVWPAHMCAHTIKLAINIMLAQHACSIANSNLSCMYPVMLTVVSACLNKIRRYEHQEEHTQKHTLRVMIHLSAETQSNSVCFDTLLSLIWIHLPLDYRCPCVQFVLTKATPEEL